MSKIYKRSNSPYYWWTARHNGTRYRRSTKQKQRAYAQKVQSEWDLNLILGKLEFLGIIDDNKVKIDEYFFNYLQFIRTRKTNKTYMVAKGVLKRLKQFLKERNILFLNDILVSTLDDYIDYLNCNPKTKKNHLGVIKRMFDQAIKEEIVDKNPALNTTLPKMIKRETPRHRLFDSIDLQIIFENAGSWKLYYMFLYYTGLRAGDVAMLTYGNINRKKKAIVSLVRKSRRVHEFPIAEVLLNELPNGKCDDEPIFPTLCSGDEQRLNFRMKKPRKYMQEILKANKRPHATLHSFRHTFNNSLRDLGLSIEDRRILMAHSSSQTTQIYTHPNFDLAHKYVNMLPQLDN